MSAKDKDQVVLIHTEMGDMKVKLYNETPKHRDNFLKHVEANVYDSLLFHRVIDSFMIQGGDIDTKPKEDSIKDKSKFDYMVDAEFHTPELFHKKGVLAAARLGDNENPEQKSSSTQFYLVTGKIFTNQMLDELEKKRLEKLKSQVLKTLQAENSEKVKELYRDGKRDTLFELRQNIQAQAAKEAEENTPAWKYTEEQREVYKTIGGTPHLDGAYTVFGEIIEGQDVVDAIAKVETDPSDRPIKNLRMSVKRMK